MLRRMRFHKWVWGGVGTDDALQGRPERGPKACVPSGPLPGLSAGFVFLPETQDTRKRSLSPGNSRNAHPCRLQALEPPGSSENLKR